MKSRRKSHYYSREVDPDREIQRLACLVKRRASSAVFWVCIGMLIILFPLLFIRLAQLF